ncbi:MAG: Cys-tRNA(Pro) deacylase [Ruminococcaceae bacterium]|nr:Cys-tRNA(Pro) deacylase [Oscillospiraceae bacterium]
MKANFKTNATRLIERAGLTHQIHTYDHSDGRIDGLAIVEKLGQDPARVFKTLVTKGADGGFYVFVVPVACELDLKAAARAAGVKSVAMIAVKDINAVTGYIRGGCSPIGMKKVYPTVVDQTAKQFDTITFSAGKIGYQIEMNPMDLAELIGCSFAPIAAKES